MGRDLIKTVVVLGMHRSGTSLVAGILSRLGVNMGDELIGKSWSNPLGHFEDKNFYRLNINILKSAGGSWDNPPSKDLIQDQMCKFEEEIKKVVEMKKSVLWGWKDPRTSLTIELYLPYLTNPYFIVCHRNKQSIAESLKRRNNMDISISKKLADTYEKRIEKFFQENSYLKRLNLVYENIIKDPKKYVMEIIDFLKLETKEEQITQAVEFILPNAIIEKHRRIQKIRRILTRPVRFAIKVLIGSQQIKENFKK